MNRKGQALVEFVLILPIFLLLVFAFIDVGRIILCKSHLESRMNDVALMVNNQKTNEEIKKFLQEDDEYEIDVSIVYDDYAKITLKTKLSLITPGMKRILSDNIKVERSIIYE